MFKISGSSLESIALLHNLTFLYSRLFYSKGLSYSALAVSDNGTFVGTGTMSEVSFELHSNSAKLRTSFLQGLVDIYTAYNLTLIRRIKGAHSTFITGLII